MWSFIDDWTSEHLEIFQYVHIISGVFFYLSSAVNPILYNLMSTRFREMFKEVMCRRSRHPVKRKYSLSVTRSTMGGLNNLTPRQVPRCAVHQTQMLIHTLDPDA
ncbi:neuromedin-U receptor 1-like [Arapaima gigas]